jgi:hypothetical protein
MDPTYQAILQTERQKRLYGVKSDKSINVENISSNSLKQEMQLVTTTCSIEHIPKASSTHRPRTKYPSYQPLDASTSLK